MDLLNASGVCEDFLAVNEINEEAFLFFFLSLDINPV